MGYKAQTSVVGCVLHALFLLSILFSSFIHLYAATRMQQTGLLLAMAGAGRWLTVSNVGEQSPALCICAVVNVSAVHSRTQTSCEKDELP